jgi:hypothetical protein
MTSQIFHIGAALMLIASVEGCSRGGTARYVPDAQPARSALETALKTWQSGAKQEPITTSKPAITLFDSRWQSGSKLESFTILGEITGQEHRQFQVRMKLAGEPEETVVYRVIGIDPLNIFRDKDYQKATGL